MLILNKGDRKVLEDVISMMEANGLNHANLDLKTKKLILVRDGTEEAQERIKESASVLDTYEYQGQKFLICRK